MTYVAVLCVWFVWFLLKRTRVGLRIRSVGENPKAAESVEKAPADMRERARLNVNARLREMGLAEIPKTPGER